MSQRHPDDDRPGAGHGDESPDLPPEWADIVIPDDARELDAEAAALRQELCAHRGRHAVERVFKTRRWQRYGMSGPLVALVLAVVAFFGSLVLLLPSPPQQPLKRPLAAPHVPAGQSGGLLPNLTLADASGSKLAIRDIRPAVVALVPRGCGCRDAVRGVIAQTEDAKLDVLLVSGSNGKTLARAASPTRVHVVSDPQWTLGSVYRASSADLTALFVRSDGIVDQTLAHVTPATSLQDEVAMLVGS